MLWFLPALFALWVNLHGGFVFGIGLLLIYSLVSVAEDLIEHRALGRETRHLLALGGASLVALSVNPSGPVGILRYVLVFFQSDAVQNFNLEFMPLSVRTSDGKVFLAVVLVFLLIAYYRRATIPNYLIVASVIFGAFSLYSRRVEPWFGMAAAPAFSELLSGQGALAGHGVETKRGKPAVNYLVIGLILVLTLASLPWLRSSLPLPQDRRNHVAAAETPVEAVGQICHLGDAVRMFNNMGYGSYLSWACPATRVFIDTRVELYPSAMWREYLLVSNGQFGWEAVLQRYDINTILASKRYEEMLVSAAKASGEWQTLFEDEHTVLLRRVPPSTG